MDLVGVDGVYRVAFVLRVGVEAEDLLVADNRLDRRGCVEFGDLQVGVVLGVVACQMRDEAVSVDVVAGAGG